MNSDKKSKTSSEQLKDQTTDAFAQQVLRWFDQHGRKTLPWQDPIHPYRVWISEIMLQQTQVTTVIPYFQRFMERFPTLEALAHAPLDEVMHHWSGLGYYARARNLHRCACLIHENYQGIFPDTVEALMELPGLGRSTAGAIVSIAFQTRAPILDGNVKRVLCRYYGVEGDPNHPKTQGKLWEIAERHTPVKRVHHYTQAMMDLGALICTRTHPQCLSCPLHLSCFAYQHQRVTEFPQKSSQKAKPVKSLQVLIVVDVSHRKVLLEKRPSKGIWGGLWSFPEILQPPSSAISLMPFRHTFTHFHWDIQPWLSTLDQTAPIFKENQLWYSLDHPEAIGLARPVALILKQVEAWYASALCPP